MTKTIWSNKKFINKARDLYGSRYDYSLTKYKGSQIKIIIICKKHNEQFLQMPMLHLQRRNGCRTCKSINRSLVNRTRTVIRCQADKNYLKLKKCIIESSNESEPEPEPEPKIKQVNNYTQTEYNKYFNYESSFQDMKQRQEVTDGFIRLSKSIHGDLAYDYSLTNYTNFKINVIIICNIHRESFCQTPLEHVKSGCPKCISNSRIIVTSL